MRWPGATFLLGFFQGDLALATAIRSTTSTLKNDFLTAITQLAAEKNLPKEVVFEAVEAALASAYKKDDLADCQPRRQDRWRQRRHARLRPEDRRRTEEDIEDDKIEITLDEARKHLAQHLRRRRRSTSRCSPQNAGRIAAQTAKQVVLQRLREAEREVVFEEYSGKEGDIISGVVQRLEAPPRLSSTSARPRPCCRRPSRCAPSTTAPASA